MKSPQIAQPAREAPSPDNHGKPWTPEQDGYLEASLRMGALLSVVAASLGRRDSAVVGRVFHRYTRLHSRLIFDHKRVKLEPHQWWVEFMKIIQAYPEVLDHRRGEGRRSRQPQKERTHGHGT
jgi:hypothetical protein